MFKRITYFTLIALMAACTKVDISSPDDFNVTTLKSTYTTSDTVEFVFSGNPGYVTFYSGEPHKKYALSKLQFSNPDSNIVVFTSNTTTASSTSQSNSVNNLSILVSTDFSGVYDSANIKKATWTNISGRATWATTTTSVSSGLVHIEDLTKSTNPFYIAFKYVSDTAKTTSLPRKWQVASFSYKNYFTDTALALAGGASGTTNPFMTGGFKQISILNPTSNWVYANAILLLMHLL